MNILRAAVATGVAASFALPALSASAIGGAVPQGNPTGDCSFSDSSQVVYVDPSNFDDPPSPDPNNVEVVYNWFYAWLENNDPFFPGSVEYILTPLDGNFDVEISFMTANESYGPIDALDTVYNPNFDDGDEWGPTEWPGLFLLRAVEVMGGGLGNWNWTALDADDFVSIIMDEDSYPLRFTVNIGDGDCTLAITYRIADRCDGPYGYLCEYLENRTDPKPVTPLPNTL